MYPGGSEIARVMSSLRKKRGFRIVQRAIGLLTRISFDTVVWNELKYTGEWESATIAWHLPERSVECEP
jgi:hypothetical protein